MEPSKSIPTINEICPRPSAEEVNRLVAQLHVPTEASITDLVQQILKQNVSSSNVNLWNESGSRRV